MTEEAERLRREAEEETARKRREVEEAEHPRAFLRDDARPEVPQRGHHQVALVKATPSHFRPHIASDEG